MAVILLSVAAGILLMAAADAPRTMIALIVSMLVTLAILAVITFVWKISVHHGNRVCAISMAAGPPKAVSSGS
jgi:hypothetical protein